MMLVDILLLVISIILMIREFFPKIEEYYSKRKRTVHIVLIGGMFVLSLINIINTNIENQNLIDTATTTLQKIDSVYINQVKSDSTLQQSVGEIKKVDSLLVGVKDTIQLQVKLLDSAIGKSTELVRLEALNFESKRADFIIADLKIVPFFKDSSQVEIQGVVKNNGRKGALLYSDFVLFITTKDASDVKFLQKNLNADFNMVSFELSQNTTNSFQIGPFAKDILNVNQKILIAVRNLIYQDILTKKIYKQPVYLAMELPFLKKGSEFVRLSPELIILTDEILKKNGFYERIYPRKYY